MSVMQPRAEAAEDKLRAVRELPRHRMDIIDGNYYPVVDQKRGSWVRANELEALLLNEPRSRPIQGGWQQKNTMTGEVTEPPLQRHE